MYMSIPYVSVYLVWRDRMGIGGFLHAHAHAPPSLLLLGVIDIFTHTRLEAGLFCARTHECIYCIYMNKETHS